MASNYWIKLYHEILDDPKMGTLPDRLYRRVIELFLLAGKFGDDGNLPDEMQISWVLRVPADDLLLDLQQLESTGIIERTADGWKVTHFAARQSPAPDAERKQRQRDREKSEQYHGNVTPTSEQRHETVTEMSRFVTQNTEADTDSDADPEGEAEAEAETGARAQKSAAAAPRPNIFKIYEREIGALTPIISDQLKAIEMDYPPGWFEMAVREAANYNRRNIAYILAILKSWKANGLPTKGSTRGTAGKRSLKEQNDAVVEMILNGEVK